MGINKTNQMKTVLIAYRVLIEIIELILLINILFVKIYNENYSFYIKNNHYFELTSLNYLSIFY